MTKMQIRKILNFFLISTVLALTACATRGTMFNHSFSFDTIGDSPDIEVLDYRYGSSGAFATYANPEMIALGETFKRGGLFGAMPRADYLYVKWRIKTTGEIFEDKVDLSLRLPQDLEMLEVRFVVRGSQLYIFVNWPWDGKAWIEESYRSEYLPVTGGIKRFNGHKQVQIYPDQPKLQNSTSISIDLPGVRHD